MEDVYKPDLVHEAITVFGADDPAHPSVQYLRTKVNPYYIGGKVQAVQAPTHYDYVSLRCKYPPPHIVFFPFAFHETFPETSLMNGSNGPVQLPRRSSARTLRNSLGEKS